MLANEPDRDKFLGIGPTAPLLPLPVVVKAGDGLGEESCNAALEPFDSVNDLVFVSVEAVPASNDGLGGGGTTFGFGGVFKGVLTAGLKGVPLPGA